LNVFAYVRGDVVRVRARFSRDSPARDCRVQVFAAGELLRHTLRTDAGGECDFRPARAEELRVVAESADGHRGEFILLAADLAAIAPAGAGATAEGAALETAPASSAADPATPPATRAAGPPPSGGVEQELAALRRQLVRMQDQLADLREPPGVQARDVIDGLCVLLGVVGAATLAAYWLQRRRDGGGASPPGRTRPG
jgi:hypothetical protein